MIVLQEVSTGIRVTQTSWMLLMVFKPHSVRWNHTWVIAGQRTYYNVIGLRREPNIFLLNEYVIKLTPNDLWYICISQPSSENLLFAVDGN